MDDKHVDADSDVELSDVGSSTDHAQRRVPRAAGAPGGGRDDDAEGDEDDEESVLQRLTGNYRRFSETQRSRSLAEEFDAQSSFGNGDDDGNDRGHRGNVQILVRNLSSQDHEDSFIEEEDDEEDEDEEEEEEDEEDEGGESEDDDEQARDEENSENEEDYEDEDEDEDGGDFSRIVRVRDLHL
ncbi:hypothetical protein PMKS-003158 [Pichia membranifaciens]|uniref:Uncharacterized protein n=1 Tax=Pichia membranifaciens TaxID=4926 RepID=A0A1Q2YJD4_9ASCO|nr:hypothetical protein PMKS-003158 [Pichia membranifaciens]